jgi:hypothetical protein
MQITIEDNSIMYIYLKSPENHLRHGKCITDVKCNLLYDESDNLIGLKLLNRRDNTQISLNGIPLTEQIKLPSVGFIDLPVHNAKISDDENNITIMFNADSVIHHTREGYSNIDLCNEGILGIEPIPFTHIMGKEIIKPFIISDIQLTLTKLE